MGRKQIFVWGVAGIVLALCLCGCPPTGGKDTPEKTDPELSSLEKELGKASSADPKFKALLKQLLNLKTQHIVEMKKKADQLEREQELQNTVRHWLLISAVATGLAAIAGGVGKLLSSGAAATWWGILLAWVGRQMRWRSIVVLGVACAGCVCLSIWLDPVWTVVRDLGYLAVLVMWTFGVWELSCRHYTGEWAHDDLVRLPAGWSVAPKA